MLSLQGRSSNEISEVLGYCGSEEVMHRDNISMTMIRNPQNSSSTELEAASLDSSNANGSASSAPDAAEPRPADRYRLLCFKEPRQCLPHQFSCKINMTLSKDTAFWRCMILSVSIRGCGAGLHYSSHLVMQK